MPQTHSLSPVGRANSEGVLFQRTEYRSRHPSSVEVGESMSWTTGASVDAAASARLFTLGENTTGLSSRGLPMAPDRSEHDVATATRRGIADNPYNSDIEAGARPEDLVVLTPTRIRVDSRVVFAHCTSNWLSNCFWLICILFKVPCGAVQICSVELQPGPCYVFSLWCSIPCPSAHSLVALTCSVIAFPDSRLCILAAVFSRLRHNFYAIACL